MTAMDTIVTAASDNRMDVAARSEAISAIRAELMANRDRDYHAFQCPLMPTVDPARVIGVRTPVLRRMARNLSGTAAADALMADLPHPYFEESQLHAFLIEPIRDMDTAVRETDRLLPFIDNWATCDQLSPRAFKGRFVDLKPHIDRWMAADAPTYTLRFGIGMLMRYGLDAEFHPDHLAAVATPAILAREDYYMRMMIAWFFATALSKQFDATLPYIEDRRLPAWTHKKTIQKALESYRVPMPHKAILRTLRAGPMSDQG